MQDTPGSDQEGVQRLLQQHIAKQHTLRALNEEDAGRSVPLHTLADTRIDACLLMLPPHVLKPKDLELLATLSTAVPVIPVFAKVSSTAVRHSALQGKVLHTLADTRMDACLLMLPPHMPKDLELLTALSTAVPNLPVFAKVSSSAV